MSRLINRSFLLGLAFTWLSACGGTAASDMDIGMDEEENLGQVEEALATCNAPVNGLADWIEASSGCTYVSVEVRNSSTNVVVLNWFAGIDTVTKYYMPLFCWNGSCSGGYWQRSGIRGDWYGPISVSLGGTVSFNNGGSTVTINPLTCGAGANGTTTITGLGSDNVNYTVVLTKTYFC